MYVSKFKLFDQPSCFYIYFKTKKYNKEQKKMLWTEQLGILHFSWVIQLKSYQQSFFSYTYGTIL